MVITCIADTHDLHREIDLLPPGDLLIHGGDVTFFSRWRSVIEDFNDWLGEQPFRHKVVVPGNHDSLLELPEYQKQITNGHLLINSGVELDGLKIWGSPVTPYANTAFGIPTAEARRKHWSRIPAGLDILVTHGPPYRILDCAPNAENHQGDPELFKAIGRCPPALVVCGHIHSGYGTYSLLGTLFVSAALAGEFGGLDKQPYRSAWTSCGMTIEVYKFLTKSRMRTPRPSAILPSFVMEMFMTPRSTPEMKVWSNSAASAS